MSDKGGIGKESEDFTEVSGSGKGIWGTFNSCARGISQTKKIWRRGAKLVLYTNKFATFAKFFGGESTVCLLFSLCFLFISTLFLNFFTSDINSEMQATTSRKTCFKFSRILSFFFRWDILNSKRKVSFTRRGGFLRRKIYSQIKHQHFHNWRAPKQRGRVLRSILLSSGLVSLVLLLLCFFFRLDTGIKHLDAMRRIWYLWQW